jgi:hypothetical protein
MLTYHYYWLEAMALGYALTELRIFPMGKTQGEKANKSTRKKCAFCPWASFAALFTLALRVQPSSINCSC